MKQITKLTATYNYPLESHTLVRTDNEPLHPDTKTYSIPIGNGTHIEIRFTARDEHREKPYPDPAPPREPSIAEVITAIETAYSMIATGTADGIRLTVPDNPETPPGFNATVARAGLALTPHETARAQWFFRAGQHQATQQP